MFLTDSQQLTAGAVYKLDPVMLVDTGNKIAGQIQKLLLSIHRSIQLCPVRHDHAAS
jgi:hypothetical protein